MNPAEPMDRAALVEQLSAYLDGELDDAESRQVEQRIASDEIARDELRRLQHAWDALDGLPPTRVEPSFTQTTVEMVALSTARDDTSDVSRRQLRRWLLAGGGMLAACVLGFLAVGLLRTDPNQALLDNLPVIENLDAYRHAKSVEFLRALRDAGLFTTDAPVANAFANAADSVKPATNMPPHAEDHETRRLRVLRMTPEQKDQLRRQQERFADLDAAEQARLRQFDAKLNSAPDDAELRRVMDRYQAWLADRTAIERAQLSELDASQRVAEIRKFVGYQQRRANRQLSPDDLKFMTAWLERKVIEGQPPERRDEINRLPAAEKRRQAVRYLFEKWQGGGAHRWMPPVREDDLAEFRANLSPQARDAIAQSVAPHERLELLADWMRQITGQYISGREGGGEANVDEDRLKRFFLQEMPEQQRAELLSLPSDEFQLRLRQMYYWNRNYRRDGAGPPGGPRPGGPRGEGGPGERPFFGPGDGKPNDGRHMDGRPGDGPMNENRPGGPRPGDGRFGDGLHPPGGQPNNMDFGRFPPDFNRPLNEDGKKPPPRSGTSPAPQSKPEPAKP